MLVVKIGGSRGVDYGAVCKDLADVWHSGERCLLVHGGSAETDELALALGHPTRTITSPSGHTSRYTDRRTLEIFAMATARRNRLLVEQLQSLGVPALGLSGLDGQLVTAQRKAAVRSVEGNKVRLLRDDWTGSVTGANGSLLNLLLGAGYLPVVAPLAISPDGEMLNVDGDRVAAAIAGAVRAQTLLLLSNVPGLLRDVADPDSLITYIDADDLREAALFAQGRMKRKLVGAGEALAGGVERVIIGDGRRTHPVQDALLGNGTVIEQGTVAELLSVAVGEELYR